MEVLTPVDSLLVLVEGNADEGATVVVKGCPKGVALVYLEGARLEVEGTCARPG